MQAAGFVLVGGRSSRMGCDKALLPLRSGLLIEEVAAKVAAAAGTAALVGEPERYRHLGFDCLPDIRRGMGPLGGIEAALQSGRAELNLIVACDMPSLETDWLCRLLLKARETDALCVASRDRTGTVHPLCAVYRNACLRSVQEALNASRLRLMDLLGELDAITLEISTEVWNINTPQQWAAWGQAH
ncbi:MAG: molybdenum cofactor guanylyltransferase [Bryobacteraceae bacterium]|jgi:molybdenum cofactor guanylyltransferase